MTGIGENTLAQPVKPPLRERCACLAKLVKNRLTLTALGALADLWAAARDAALDMERAIEASLEENCPALLAMYGCGPVSAAKLAVAAGDNPGRLRSEASFAAICGACPIPASSGKTVRWIGNIYLDDSGRDSPASLNSTGDM